MKNAGIFNLEEVLDKIKFADLDVAIYYGDNLLKNINALSQHIQTIITNAEEYKLPKEMMTHLNEAKLEARMMQIAVNDMKNYLTGYREKKEPSQVEEINATEDWGFTEEEIEKVKKQQSEYTPEQKAILERYNPKQFQDEQEM